MVLNDAVPHIHQEDAKVFTGAVRDFRTHGDYPIVLVGGKTLHSGAGEHRHGIMDCIRVPTFLHHIFRDRHIQIFLIRKDAPILGHHHERLDVSIITKNRHNLPHQIWLRSIFLSGEILPEHGIRRKDIGLPFYSGNVGRNIGTAHLQLITCL